MDRDEALDVLGRVGWLSGTPARFRKAFLSECHWQNLEAGALIQTGGAVDAEMSGLASGIIEFRTVLGRADIPTMHFARPVFWFGYGRVISQRRPHRVQAIAKTPVWLARVSAATVRTLLAQHPDWWQYFLPLAVFFADIALDVAEDLMIADSERRCAAVLLRLTGYRFPDPQSPEPIDVSITQEDLAGAANLSLTSVRSMLGRLATRGLIEQGYGGIVVRAPAALRAFVDEG